MRVRAWSSDGRATRCEHMSLASRTTPSGRPENAGIKLKLERRDEMILPGEDPKKAAAVPSFCDSVSTCALPSVRAALGLGGAVSAGVPHLSLDRGRGSEVCAYKTVCSRKAEERELRVRKLHSTNDTDGTFGDPCELSDARPCNRINTTRL